MLDRLTSLEVFAKVAAIGSLSGAARTMGLSQTMVTKHVASLEARLGIKLFHRTTRRLSITEAGRRKVNDKRGARTEQIATALAGGFSDDELGLLLAAAPLIERLAEKL